MFPLACQSTPVTGDELAQALRGALDELFILQGDKADSVVMRGTFPSVDAFEVHLDNAKVRFIEPPPKPAPLGQPAFLCEAKSFSIVGEPIVYDQARLNLRLVATDARFSFDKEKAGQSLLLIDGARQGSVQATINARELEAALRTAATAGAKEYVTLEDLTLHLKSKDDRTLSATLRVKARKMMMSGIIEIAGNVHVDDELNLHLSELTCTGEGLLSKTVAAMIRPKLAEQEKKPIPLTAFSLGDIRLRDLKIHAGELIEISATFGA